jgi:FeS assembly SUF system protein
MVFSGLFGRKKKNQVPEAELPLPAPPSASEPEPQATAAAGMFTCEQMEQAVVEVLRTVYDPEIPVNIYEMGLVYDVDVDAAGKAVVRMTLTSPGCPVAGSLIPEIEGKVRLIPGITKSKVILVWDPPWDPNMMSEAAKLQLGMF